MFEHVRNDPFLFVETNVQTHIITVIMEQTKRIVIDYESREVAILFADVFGLPEGQR